MTLSDLRTHLLDLLGQDSSAQDVFSTALLNRWINIAGKDLARFIRKFSPYEFTKSGSLAITAGTREYDLIATFSDFLDLHFVEQAVTGTTRPERMTVDRVSTRGDRHIPQRLYLSATTLGFYIDPGSNDTLTVHYAPTLTALSSDNDNWDTLSFQTPRVRDEFHDTILYEAAASLLAAEGADPPTMMNVMRGKAGEAKEAIRDALARRVSKPRFMNTSSRTRRRIS